MDPHTLLVKMGDGAAPSVNSVAVPQKVTERKDDPAIPRLGMCRGAMKTRVHTKPCT